MRVVEGTHVVLLRKIKGKRSRRTTYGTWETPAAVEVLRAAGMHMSVTYIGRRKGAVEQWVALRPIFEVCE